MRLTWRSLSEAEQHQLFKDRKLASEKAERCRMPRSVQRGDLPL
jgi:hypothetical protein